MPVPCQSKAASPGAQARGTQRWMLKLGRPEYSLPLQPPSQHSCPINCSPDWALPGRSGQQPAPVQQLYSHCGVRCSWKLTPSAFRTGQNQAQNVSGGEGDRRNKNKLLLDVLPLPSPEQLPQLSVAQHLLACFHTSGAPCGGVAGVFLLLSTLEWSGVTLGSTRSDEILGLAWLLEHLIQDGHSWLASLAAWRGEQLTMQVTVAALCPQGFPARMLWR